jgi:hypothetical protein
MNDIILTSYCCSDENIKAKNLLQKYSDIDLTEDGGIYFRIAIKHKNPEMLNILLDYYEKTKMSENRDSIEYQTAKDKLQQILKDAVKSFDTSDEIQEILNRYIPQDNDTISEQDSQDLENDFSDLESSATDQSNDDLTDDINYLTLTEDNLMKHDSGLIGDSGSSETE